MTDHPSDAQLTDRADTTLTDLRESLRWAVPIRITELQTEYPAGRAGRDTHLTGLATRGGRYLGSGGDCLQWPGRRTALVWGHTVSGIAAMALLNGRARVLGVEFIPGPVAPFTPEFTASYREGWAHLVDTLAFLVGEGPDPGPPPEVPDGIVARQPPEPVSAPAVRVFVPAQRAVVDVPVNAFLSDTEATL